MLSNKGKIFNRILTVLGPGTVIGDGEIVPAKTLLDRHHGEVKA